MKYQLHRYVIFLRKCSRNLAFQYFWSWWDVAAQILWWQCWDRELKVYIFFLFAGWEQWGGRQMRQGKQKCGSRYVGIQGLRKPVNSDSIYIDILHWETNEHHCPPASMLQWVLELGREFVERGWGWLRLEELRRFWLNAVASKCHSLKLQEEIYLRTKSV